MKGSKGHSSEDSPTATTEDAGANPTIQSGVEAPTRYNTKPWKFKLLALACSCLIAIGSHFASQMLAALKTQLKEVCLHPPPHAPVSLCLPPPTTHLTGSFSSLCSPFLTQELGITNVQYGLLQSAVSLINTILPFFGGIFIDVFGTGAGSVLACSLILAGDVMVAMSTHMASYPVMVLGRLVYGYTHCCLLLKSVTSRHSPCSTHVLPCGICE